MTVKTAIASLLVGGVLAAGAAQANAEAPSDRKAKDKIEDRAEAQKDKAQARADSEKDRAQNQADAEKNRIDQRAEAAKDRVDTKAMDNNKKGKEPSVGDDVSDSWITTKLKAQYTTESAFKNASIKVDTENRGHVRLQGTVPTEAARAKALEVARATKGVRDVRDDLIVGAKK